MEWLYHWWPFSIQLSLHSLNLPILMSRSVLRCFFAYMACGFYGNLDGFLTTYPEQQLIKVALEESLNLWFWYLSTFIWHRFHKILGTIVARYLSIVAIRTNLSPHIFATNCPHHCNILDFLKTLKFYCHITINYIYLVYKELTRHYFIGNWNSMNTQQHMTMQHFNPFSWMNLIHVCCTRTRLPWHQE